MAEPKHDWYLKDWLKSLGKKQADLERDLEMNKAKVSLTANGKQPYDRDDVNMIAAYLHLEPFELLLPPDRAMAYRQLRASAETIVKEVQAPDENTVKLVFKRAQPAAKKKRKTGTHG